MYDWISISLVLSITILCPSVFNIKWIHFDGYYRCMSFWTAIMLWRVNNSSANAHTITLWSRSSLDSLASIAMWNLHPIWNGAYEICFKFFFLSLPNECARAIGQKSLHFCCCSAWLTNSFMASMQRMLFECVLNSSNERWWQQQQQQPQQYHRLQALHNAAADAAAIAVAVAVAITCVHIGYDLSDESARDKEKESEKKIAFYAKECKKEN